LRRLESVAEKKGCKTPLRETGSRVRAVDTGRDEKGKKKRQKSVLKENDVPGKTKKSRKDRVFGEGTRSEMEERN